MVEPGIRIRELRSADDPALPDAHGLLRRVFPRWELVPLRDWREAIRERRAGLWTDISWHGFVAERAGSVIGMATGNYLGNVNLGIVGYVAVAARHRSHGLGPRLRRRLRQAFERDARRIRRRQLTAIVGEVKLDNPWLRHLVARDDAVALDFRYIQPALRRGGPEVPLVMYYQPLGRVRRSLGVDEVRRLLYTMWRRVYRIAKPLGHRSFRAMLSSLAGRSRIGSLPLPAARTPGPADGSRPHPR